MYTQRCVLQWFRAAWFFAPLQVPSLLSLSTTMGKLSRPPLPLSLRKEENGSTESIRGGSGASLSHCPHPTRGLGGLGIRRGRSPLNGGSRRGGGNGYHHVVKKNLPLSRHGPLCHVPLLCYAGSNVVIVSVMHRNGEGRRRRRRIWGDQFGPLSGGGGGVSMGKRKREAVSARESAHGETQNRSLSSCVLYFFRSQNSANGLGVWLLLLLREKEGLETARCSSIRGKS